MKKIYSLSFKFFLAATVLISGCHQESYEKLTPTHPLSKAEMAVSSPATQSLLVDILKFQKQVLAGLDQLTEDEKRKVKILVVEFQQATDDISRNAVIRSLETILKIDYNTINLRFAKRAPKVIRELEGISEREIILATNSFLKSKGRMSSLLKSRSEMSLEELEALIEESTPTSCDGDGPESRASAEECVCIGICTAACLAGIAGCTATGPMAPPCYAGIAIIMTGCIASCV